MASPRWSALVRTGVDAATIGTWDPGLVRDTRVLVPIDVQALYVPAGIDRADVPHSACARGGRRSSRPRRQRPCSRTARRAKPASICTGLPPDALLRGSFDADRSTNRLGLATLPDRWVVVRVLVPKGTTAGARARLGHRSRHREGCID